MMTGSTLKNSAGRDPGTGDTPKDIVSRVISPEETLLWSGRPNSALMIRKQTRGTGERSLARIWVILAMGAGLTYWFVRENPGIPLPGSAQQVNELLSGKAAIPLLVLVAIFIASRFLRKKNWDVEGSYKRWAESLTYGITDRRLLILENGDIATELGPEDFGEPRIRDRANGHADVEFKELSSSSGARENSYSRDRRRLAFKALQNAEQVKRLVDDWRRKLREREEHAVKEFLDAGGHTGAQHRVATGVRVIHNDKYGLSVSVPDSWDLNVRKRRKPYGKVFLDFERWKSPEELSDWNVLKIEGDFLNSVEIHLDHVRKPMVVYQQAKNSSLINAMSGEIIESDDDVKKNGFSGFSITRRHIEQGQDAGGVNRERPAFHRWMVLHDGRTQIGLSMKWPDNSEPLKRAVLGIYESIRVD